MRDSLVRASALFGALLLPVAAGAWPGPLLVGDEARVRALPGVQDVLVARPGPGARLLDEPA